MNLTMSMVLLSCVALSFLIFRAAVRTLDIKVRWWRLIAGLILLRISGAVLTPVLPWLEHALRSMLTAGG
jgi:hypothetical protein